MPFISEDDKYRFSLAIDNVIQAKILLERRGVYPKDNMAFYPNDSYLSTDEIMFQSLQMVEIGTGWELLEVEVKDSGITHGLIHSRELQDIFEIYHELELEQQEEIFALLESYKEYVDDDYGFFNCNIIFGMDGKISIFAEYVYGGLSGFLNCMLDFHELVKELLKEVRNNSKKEGVA